MDEKLTLIPAEKRWEIATKGLTGAYMACAIALREAIGDERYKVFTQRLWGMAGARSKELADSMGLKVDDAKGINQAALTLAVTSMGPEFEFQEVEANENKTVVRTAKCPWHERAKELGAPDNLCAYAHQQWGDSVVKSLNPKFSFTLTNSMSEGSPYCEWVIEQKI